MKENISIAQNVKIDLNGVMETVPVADGWEAVKDADGTWTISWLQVRMQVRISVMLPNSLWVVAADSQASHRQEERILRDFLMR